MPPQLYFGGRTPPAIKLLPNVNKAGSCRRYEIREDTPESGKSKSPRGESPLQDKVPHPGNGEKQVIQW